MKTGNFIGAINLCDICQRKRNRGNHAACSETRKARFATENATRRKAK